MSDLRDIWAAIQALSDQLEQLRKVDVGGVAVAYTPTYTGVTTPGETTYTTQVGFYTRFTDLVFFNGFLVWTAATGTGNVQISTPFTTRNTTNMRYAVTLRYDSITYAGTGAQALLNPGASAFTLTSPNSNASSSAINVEAAGNVVFSGWFTV